MSKSVILPERGEGDSVMSKGVQVSSRLLRMKNNPRGNWGIADVEAVCSEACVSCNPPTGGGSHYKVSHSSQPEILTIPAGRRIKPPYIRKLVKFLEQVTAARARNVI